MTLDPGHRQGSRRWSYLALVALFVACEAPAPVEPEVAARPDEVDVEGLWAGADVAGKEQRLVCLKMVEPDSAAAFELVEVDTLAGAGLIAAGEGTWSYRPPRVDIELSRWPDPGDVPRLSAELGSTGKLLLLRVSYRQGDQFTVALERATRCGRFFG